MSAAQAANIQYELSDLGAGRFRYAYTVSNDALSDPLEGFDVFFDPGLFDEGSLQIVTPAPLASDWDELILGSGALVPALYDVFAVAGGIPVGGLQAGFAVEFSWLGPGRPGAQPFEVFDPNTFEVLESGFTVPIPEPGTAVSILLGLSILARGSRGPGPNRGRESMRSGGRSSL